MVERLGKKGRKWTNWILAGISLIIIIYIASIKGIIPIGIYQSVVLGESKQIITLDAKEKSYIGMNKRQVYHVTQDGIKAYDLEGSELWQDTFSLENFVVMQKEPYIAVGAQKGKSIYVFSDKGKQYEITSNNPIIYFSINKLGSMVTISYKDNEYMVTAYNEYGSEVSRRATYVKEEGYPIVAEISPDSKKVMMAYVSVDEPQVVSRVYIMDTIPKGNADKVLDNVQYGSEQKNNLVYEIEFVNKDTWVAIGDKLSVWYNSEGEQIATQANTSVVFVPYLYSMSEHGLGYLPMILSEKPTQNIVHRQDELVYFNHMGEKTFSTQLEKGVESAYADGNGTIIQLDHVFKGYNKMGNLTFEYAATTDVTKVIYIPAIRKGIAVKKEGVILLEPIKEDSPND